MKPRIKPDVVMAISYNREKGGAASDSLRQLILMAQAVMVDIDYYAIMPPTPDLGEIYENEEKRQAVFSRAKLNAETSLGFANCLIIPGNGAIVDPRLYGSSLKKTDLIDLARAIAEMALIHIAMQKGMPILAVCGGHQLLNVYLDGKMKDVDNDANDPYLGYSTNLFFADTELAKIAFKGFNKLEGLFFGAHTQIVDQVGGKKMVMGDDLLKVAGVSKKDLTVEAMEAKYGAPIYSLQFHPEVAMVGMYSTLLKKITYFSPTEVTRIINFNMIKAFKEAAETYVLKQLTLKQLAIQPTKAKDKLDISEVDDKPNCAKFTVSLHSMFREAKTDILTADKNRLQTRKRS